MKHVQMKALLRGTVAGPGFIAHVDPDNPEAKVVTVCEEAAVMLENKGYAKRLNLVDADDLEDGEGRNVFDDFAKQQEIDAAIEAEVERRLALALAEKAGSADQDPPAHPADSAEDLSFDVAVDTGTAEGEAAAAESEGADAAPAGEEAGEEEGEDAAPAGEGKRKPGRPRS